MDVPSRNPRQPSADRDRYPELHHPIPSWFRTFDWIDEGVLAGCMYPRDDAMLAELAGRGVTLLINLHERAHPPELLARYGLTEMHLPVQDMTPPTPEQLDRGVAALERAANAGTIAAVHCGAGLGRTGTVLACYMVRRGMGPGEAIAHIRAARPGSVETLEQEAAVEAYARRLHREDDASMQ